MKPTVFRSKVAWVFGWAWIVFALLNAWDLAVRGTMPSALIAAAVLGIITVFVFLTALRPAIVAEAGGVRVRNPLRTAYIPWNALGADSRSDFKKITAAAGQAVTGPTLALRSTASPSPSASPSPTPEAEEDEEAPAEEQTPAAANNNPTSSSQSDGGGFGSWLLILLGGLLVAIGVGAIVLLLVRRKENLDEESPESDEASGSYRSGDDGYRAGDDATRVAPRQDAEPTMVASSLADAPTMVQHVPPVKDEYPDPYGAPAPAGYDMDFH